MKQTVIESLKDTAKKVLLKNGEHMPQICAYTSRGGIFLLLADLPDDKTSTFVTAAIGAGSKVADNGGDLQEVYFISEGWLGSMEQFNLMKLRPKEQPNKIEALLISGRNLQKQIDFFEIMRIKRNKDNEIISVDEIPSPIKTKIQPVISAFIFGYYSQKELNKKQN